MSANAASIVSTTRSRLPTRSRLVANPGAAESIPKPAASFCHRLSLPQDELDHPVGAREQPVGTDRRVVVATGVADLAGDGVPRALEGVDADDGGEQGRAHDASLPVRWRSCSADDDAVGAVHPGEQVADRHADALRVVGVGAGERHQAALALRDLVVPGPPALGPVVAEPADRQQDEPGVELVEPLDGEAEPVEHAGAEVLEQHVGAGDEPGQRLAALVGLQVEGHRLLVAVARQEVRRDRLVVGAHEGRSPATRLVAAPGGLDLDDAGAHVGEHHPAVGPGEGPGQVDDDDVVEGSAHGALLASLEEPVCRQPSHAASVTVRQGGP